RAGIASHLCTDASCKPALYVLLRWCQGHETSTSRSVYRPFAPLRQPCTITRHPASRMSASASHSAILRTLADTLLPLVVCTAIVSPLPTPNTSTTPNRSCRMRAWLFHLSTTAARYPSLRRWLSVRWVGGMQSPPAFPPTDPVR